MVFHFSSAISCKIEVLKSFISDTLWDFRRAIIGVLFTSLCAVPLNAASAAEVKLAWDPSSGDVAGYVIYYGLSSKNYQYNLDVKNNTTCTISGLEPGRTYYYAATAYNNNLTQSTFSEELVHTVPVIDGTDDGVPNEDESNNSGTGSNGDSNIGGTDDSTGSQLPGSGSVIIAAINGGGPEYVDAQGTVYQADTLFSGGRTYKKKKI